MTGGDSPAPDPDVAHYGQLIIAVAVVTMAVSGLFVSMRLWSRVVILRSVAVEDAFILPAWVCQIATIPHPGPISPLM
jgi:hypothetical protein